MVHSESPVPLPVSFDWMDVATLSVGFIATPFVRDDPPTSQRRPPVRSRSWSAFSSTNGLFNEYPRLVHERSCTENEKKTENPKRSPCHCGKIGLDSNLELADGGTKWNR